MEVLFLSRKRMLKVYVQPPKTFVPVVLLFNTKRTYAHRSCAFCRGKAKGEREWIGLMKTRSSKSECSSTYTYVLCSTDKHVDRRRTVTVTFKEKKGKKEREREREIVSPRKRSPSLVWERINKAARYMSCTGGQNRSDVLARAQENKRGGGKKKKKVNYPLRPWI